MEIRTLLIIGILSFATAGIFNAIWFGLELKRFADRTPVLASPLDMMRFKKVVAHQMHAALVQIVLLMSPLIIFFVGTTFDLLAPGDIFLVIVPSAVMILVAMISKGHEQRVKTIPTNDPELESQRDAIVKIWLRKALPDW